MDFGPLHRYRQRGKFIPVTHCDNNLLQVGAGGSAWPAETWQTWCQSQTGFKSAEQGAMSMKWRWIECQGDMKIACLVKLRREIVLPSKTDWWQSMKMSQKGSGPQTNRFMPSFYDTVPVYQSYSIGWMMTNHLFQVGLIMFGNFSHWKGSHMFPEETWMGFFLSLESCYRFNWRWLQLKKMLRGFATSRFKRSPKGKVHMLNNI